MCFNAGTLTRPAPSSIKTQHYASSVNVRSTEKGSKILEGIRIFKQGTFADSMGIEHTWTDHHLSLMSLHFRLLRDGGFFPNVPIRVDHSWSAKDVVGYFVDVYPATDDPAFLAADIELTEPDAFEKWERGTYRSRSLEVGMYETNEGVAYWPVIMGMAFVDIPAVEGLHARNASQYGFSQRVEDKENPGQMHFPDRNVDMAAWTAAVNADPDGFQRACTYAEWEIAANYAKACDDWTRAAIYAQALADEETARHARQQAGQPATFRVNGSETADHASVQRHIDTLETFRTETIQGGRAEYVRSLTSDHKIAAPMEASLLALVATMDEAQFAAFKAGYDAAPSATLFGQHGVQPGDTTNPQGGTNPGEPGSGSGVTEKDDLTEIIRNHQRSGKSPEFIKGTQSFKRLTAIDAAAAAALVP